MKNKFRVNRGENSKVRNKYDTENNKGPILVYRPQVHFCIKLVRVKLVSPKLIPPKLVPHNLLYTIRIRVLSRSLSL